MRDSSARSWGVSLPSLRWPPRAYAWALLALLLVPLSLLSRNGAGYFLFPPLAAAALLLAPPAGQPRWRIDRGLFYPLLLLFLWAAISLLWTPESLEIAGKQWLITVAVTLITLASVGAAAGATAAEQRLVLRALLIGFLIGFALYVSEYFTDAAIHRWRYSKDQMSVGRAFSQAAGPLVLMGVIALVLAGALKSPWRFLLPAGVLALSILFDHKTGIIGLPAAAIAWSVARWWPLLARRLWTLILLLALLVVPFQGLLLDRLDDGWKSREILIREQIWRVGAERLLEKPIIGWGFEGSGNLPNTGEPSLRENKEAVITNHPHSIGLQLWLELGIPGVLLGGWFLFAIRRRLQAPAAHAMFIFLLIQGSVSAAIWPSRWLTMACIAAFLWTLLAPRTEPPRPKS